MTIGYYPRFYSEETCASSGLRGCAAGETNLVGENARGGVKTTLLPPHASRRGQASQLTVGDVPTVRRVDHAEMPASVRETLGEDYKVWQRFQPAGHCDGRKQRITVRRDGGSSSFVLLHEPYVPDDQPVSIG